MYYRLQMLGLTLVHILMKSASFPLTILANLQVYRNIRLSISMPVCSPYKCVRVHLLMRVAHVAMVQNETCYLSDLVTVPVVPLSNCYFQHSFSVLTR